MSRYVTPVEVVTPKGTARHAAYIPAGESHPHTMPSALGICGRAKNADWLTRVDWLDACGLRQNGPICKACWRQVAFDEGVTS